MIRSYLNFRPLGKSTISLVKATKTLTLVAFLFAALDTHALEPQLFEPQPPETPAPRRQSLESIYPAALPNSDLRAELEGDDDRMIPQFEKFSLAADSIAFLRTLGLEDFYHGVGYWIQFRSEVRPHPHFTINARSILYSGSSSEGYATPFGFYTLIGFTGFWPEDIAGFKTKIRIVDIGRQTVAEGLLIQEREMNGGLVEISRGGFQFRVLGDSTGALVSSDDMLNAQVSLFDEAVRLGRIWWVSGTIEAKLPENRTPYDYLALRSPVNFPLLVASEIGRRASANAWMIKVGHAHEWQSIGLKHSIEVQRREYGDGFGDTFTENIQHQYVSFDQYDKLFTSPMNIFAFGEGAKVNALITRIEYAISPKWKVRGASEIGEFDFPDHPATPGTSIEDKPYHFYRADLVHCPIEGREDCLLLHASNKVLTESYSRPPQNESRANKPFFKSVAYVGLEARFRF